MRVKYHCASGEWGRRSFALWQFENGKTDRFLSRSSPNPCKHKHDRTEEFLVSSWSALMIKDPKDVAVEHQLPSIHSQADHLHWTGIRLPARPGCVSSHGIRTVHTFHPVTHMRFHIALCHLPRSRHAWHVMILGITRGRKWGNKDKDYKPCHFFACPLHYPLQGWAVPDVFAHK